MKDNVQFDEGVRRAIASDPEYAASYFEELRTRPLPVQLALLRRLLGWTQQRLAEELGLKQTHVSRLEKAGSDHLASLYERAARKLGARLAIVPDDLRWFRSAAWQRGERHADREFKAGKGKRYGSVKSALNDLGK